MARPPPQNLTGGRRTLSAGELLDLQRDAQVRALDEEARTLLAELRGKVPAQLVTALRGVARTVEPRAWEQVRAKVAGVQEAEWPTLQSALPQLDRATVDRLAELKAFDATSVDPLLAALPAKSSGSFTAALPILARLDFATRRVLLRSPQVPDRGSLDAVLKAWPKAPPDLVRRAAAVMIQLPRDQVDPVITAAAAKVRAP